MLVLFLKLPCSLSNIMLFLSISVTYWSRETLYKYSFFFSKTHDHVLVFPMPVIGLCFWDVLLYLSHYIHINTAKVNILKSCPRLCPLSLSMRTKLFFFFPLPGNHHSINIPPRYKVLMSACLPSLTLISPKVLEQGGGGTLREERKKELLAYPANGCGGIVKQSRLPSR